MGSVHLSPEEAVRVDAALTRVGLGGMGGRRPADVSGGQQGRAALARLMLQERPVALLDEPFAALDPGLRRDMLELLARPDIDAVTIDVGDDVLLEHVAVTDEPGIACVHGDGSSRLVLQRLFDKDLTCSLITVMAFPIKSMFST